MAVVDLVTFILIIALMIFLFVKRLREEKYRREHPEEFVEEERRREEALKEFLKSLEIELEEEELVPAPPPPPPEMPRSETEQQHPKEITHHIAKDPFAVTEKLKRSPYTAPRGMRETNIVLGRRLDHKFEVVSSGKSSRGRKLLSRVPSPKELVIYHEIIGPSGGKIKINDRW